MKPIDFPEANLKLVPPEGRPDVDEMRVFRGNGLIVSCWQLSDDEVAELWETRKLWVVIEGDTHAPLAPSAAYPFIKQN